MKAVVYRKALMSVLAFMTALWTGLQIVHLLRVRQFARTFTTYGKLPEIPVAVVDYVVLGAAVLLLAAAVVAAFRIRIGAGLALCATTTQWIYYGPALWAHIRGDGWFEPVPGRSANAPWQQFAWLGATMLCAAWLTWDRGLTRAKENGTEPATTGRTGRA